ncbi:MULTISPECIES: hypothetical protein [unclassified Methanobrevibacter]|uniref:hypothetical protein n=1 Tax=unclassified Methanobrevibacter TaxID=2638681 RepID=UPI0025D872AC|nr:MULTISPECIES: hypothetical protein [unclassified Methanobrevibacter]MEE0943372.1 hypothetical protein [Methanobrevibacter sp.]
MVTICNQLKLPFRKIENPEGFYESKNVAIDGRTIAGNARREFESRTGKKVVSSKNSKYPKLLDEKFLFK